MGAALPSPAGRVPDNPAVVRAGRRVFLVHGPGTAGARAGPAVYGGPGIRRHRLRSTRRDPPLPARRGPKRRRHHQPDCPDSGSRIYPHSSPSQYETGADAEKRANFARVNLLSRGFHSPVQT